MRAVVNLTRCQGYAQWAFELLRYEPPVQFLTGRSALADIDIAGTTIPHGSPIMLMVAAGNRASTAPAAVTF